MKCADCLDSLGAFVDGELPPDEMAHVEKHLSSCSDCSAAHSRMVETSSMLKTNLIVYEAPDVLKARIRASLAEHAGELTREQRPTLVGRGYQWPRLLAAAATVAIVSSGHFMLAAPGQGKSFSSPAFSSSSWLQAAMASRAVSSQACRSCLSRS